MTQSTHPTATDIVTSALMHTGVMSERAVAEQVIAVLGRAGFVVLAPQDLLWGECPDYNGDDGKPGPHEISTSLCVWCLEYDAE